ncbi:MAG: EAL domain-containing protein [Caloramator sp.]|nr:EAL domain-containing protein [Caloramator sp.]
MKLKNKILKTIVYSILIYFLLILLFQTFFIRPKFKLFMKSLMVNEVQRNMNLLEKEMELLRISTRDYAVWDETYDFVTLKNKDYIEENYNALVLKNLGVSIVVILDNKGKFVYGITRNDQELKEEIDERILEAIISKQLYKENFVGFLGLDRNIYFFAGEGIFKSDGTGKRQGIIVFGKNLDEVKLNTQLKYEFIHLCDLEKRDYEKIMELMKNSNKINLNQKEIFITKENNNLYAAIYPIKDFMGNVISLYKIYISKDLENNIEKMGIVIAFVVLVFGLFIVILLNFKFSLLINNPIEQIIENINVFTRKMENKLNFNLYNRQDEISDLAKSIDILKADIVEKQNKLENINKTLELKVKERTKELEIKNKEILLSDKILSETLDGIIIIDNEKRILKINKALKRMLGFSEEDLIKNKIDILNFEDGKESINNIFNLIEQRGYWRGEVRIKNKNNIKLPVLLSVTFLQFDEDKVYILILSDISELNEKEEKLEKLAYFDTLTDLPNRNSFMKKIKELTMNTSIKSFALLFIDLDGFKLINYTLGHDIGDKVLKKVAERISICIDKGDIAFRLGGDEFIVLLDNIESEHEAIEYAKKIINEISKPLFIDSFDIKTSGSIGIVMYPKDDTTLEGLYRKADAALSEAKERAKGGYLFFSEEIEKKNKNFIEIENGLRRALADNEFSLYIQPIYREVNGEFIITKGELLLRWVKNNKIVYPPDKFIKVAESNGMIIDIGNWVMGEAYKIRQKLIENSIDIDLCINISAKQLEDKYLFDNIKRYLYNEKNTFGNWIFEITENMLIKDLKYSTNVLKELKSLGIKIALDDFGTGYSSINYLSQLPINYIKIDKGFIEKVGQGDFNGVILAIISMAKSLGVKTVAEGVESKEQVKILKSFGCDEFQGYFFSRPIAFDEFIKNFALLNNIKI